MCKYEGANANEFIALEMILDWDRKGEASKKSPVVNREVQRVGISNKAHKSVVNLIQLIYIKQVVNTME